jgi:uncharacterized protein involved in exopolysaccharide biosynthesis
MAINHTQIEGEDEYISLLEIKNKLNNLIGYLKTKWKIIFISILIGGLLGLAYSNSKKIIYKAVLRFAVEEDKNSGGGLGSALASSFGVDIGGGGSIFSTSNIGDLMKSRLIVEKVLLKPVEVSGKVLSIAEYYIQLKQLRQNWELNPKLKNIQFLPNSDRTTYKIEQDSILQSIYLDLISDDKLIIIQRDKKVTFLSLEIQSENELFAKLFCENLANETSNFYIQTKNKKSRINVEILQKQVDSIRSELNTSISGVAKEVDNIYNLNPSLNIRGAESQKKRIDVQSNGTLLTSLVVQLELAKIALRKETPLVQEIDRPIFPLEKKRLSKSKGIVLGIFFSFFIINLFLIITRYFQKNNLVNENYN